MDFAFTVRVPVAGKVKLRLPSPLPRGFAVAVTATNGDRVVLSDALSGGEVEVRVDKGTVPYTLTYVRSGASGSGLGSEIGVTWCEFLSALNRRSEGTLCTPLCVILAWLSALCYRARQQRRSRRMRSTPSWTSSLIATSTVTTTKRWCWLTACCPVGRKPLACTLPDRSRLGFVALLPFI